MQEEAGGGSGRQALPVACACAPAVVKSAPLASAAPAPPVIQYVHELVSEPPRRMQVRHMRHATRSEHLTHNLAGENSNLPLFIAQQPPPLLFLLPLHIGGSHMTNAGTVPRHLQMCILWLHGTSTAHVIQLACHPGLYPGSMPSTSMDARIRGLDKCSDGVNDPTSFYATAAVTTTSIK